MIPLAQVTSSIRSAERAGRSGALALSLAAHVAGGVALFALASPPFSAGDGPANGPGLSVALVGVSVLAGTTPSAPEPAATAGAEVQPEPLSTVEAGTPAAPEPEVDQSALVIDSALGSAEADAATKGGGGEAEVSLQAYVEPCWRRLGGPDVGAGAAVRVALGPGGTVLDVELVGATDKLADASRAGAAGQRALRAVLACGPYAPVEAGRVHTLRFE